MGDHRSAEAYFCGTRYGTAGRNLAEMLENGAIAVLRKMYADRAFLLGKQASGNTYGGVELQSPAVTRRTHAGNQPRLLPWEAAEGPAETDVRETMSNLTGRASATIHQFPVGGRAGVARFGGVRENGEASVARLFPPVAVVEFGSGWYHQAAIEEAADPSRKH